MYTSFFSTRSTVNKFSFSNCFVSIHISPLKSFGSNFIGHNFYYLQYSWNDYCITVTNLRDPIQSDPTIGSLPLLRAKRVLGQVRKLERQVQQVRRVTSAQVGASGAIGAPSWPVVWSTVDLQRMHQHSNFDLVVHALFLYIGQASLHIRM